MKKSIVFSLCWIIFSLFLRSDAGRVVIQQVDTSLYPEMKIFLSVLDSEGKLVLGLKKENFQILENDAPVKNFKVGGVFKNMEWLALTLVMDRSGSMAGEYLSQAKTAAMDFIDNLGLGDRVALVTFHSDIQLASDFVQDKETLRPIIASITAVKNTALYDAILFALAGIKDQPSARKTVIALTDGRDTHSRATIGECLEKVKEAGIPVFMIGLGGKLNEEILQNIATESGGSYFPAPQPQDLLEIYRRISRQLENQYVLLYRSRALDAKGVGTLRVNLERNGETAHDRRYFALVRDVPSEVNGGGDALAPVAAVQARVTAAAVKTIPTRLLFFGLAGALLGFVISLLLVFLIKKIRAAGRGSKSLIMFLLTVLFAMAGVLVFMALHGGITT